MPAPFPASDRPAVRDNQTLDFDGLRREAAAAVEASGKSQTDVGRALVPPVTPAAVSRALSDKEPPGRYAPLQARIIAALTDYTVEDETRPTFRVKRKA